MIIIAMLRTAMGYNKLYSANSKGLVRTCKCVFEHQRSQVVESVINVVDGQSVLSLCSGDVLSTHEPLCNSPRIIRGNLKHLKPERRSANENLISITQTRARAHTHTHSASVCLACVGASSDKAMLFQMPVPV